MATKQDDTAQLLRALRTARMLLAAIVLQVGKIEVEPRYLREAKESTLFWYDDPATGKFVVDVKR